MSSAQPKPLASVQRALRIVEFLCTADIRGVPLAAVASGLEINKTTAYNALVTLKDQGWVDQDQATGRYRLGGGIRPIVEYSARVDRVIERIHPALAAARTRANELVHLGSLSGRRVVYRDKVEPDRPIRVVSQIGREIPAVITAMGRALIGSLPDRDERLDWFMSDPALDSFAPERKAAIRQAVASNFLLLDRRGWSQEIGESEPGIACVAVPFVTSEIPLAISITAPVERMPDHRYAELAQIATEALQALPASADVTVATAARSR